MSPKDKMLSPENNYCLQTIQSKSSWPENGGTVVQPSLGTVKHSNNCCLGSPYHKQVVGIPGRFTDLNDYRHRASSHEQAKRIQNQYKRQRKSSMESLWLNYDHREKRERKHRDRDACMNCSHKESKGSKRRAAPVHRSDNHRGSLSKSSNTSRSVHRHKGSYGNAQYHHGHHHKRLSKSTITVLGGNNDSCGHSKGPGICIGHSHKRGSRDNPKRILNSQSKSAKYKDQHHASRTVSPVFHQVNGEFQQQNQQPIAYHQVAANYDNQPQSNGGIVMVNDGRMQNQPDQNVMMSRMTQKNRDSLQQQLASTGYNSYQQNIQSTAQNSSTDKQNQSEFLNLQINSTGFFPGQMPNGQPMNQMPHRQQYPQQSGQPYMNRESNYGGREHGRRTDTGGDNTPLLSSIEYVDPQETLENTQNMADQMAAQMGENVDSLEQTQLMSSSAFTNSRKLAMMGSGPQAVAASLDLDSTDAVPLSRHADNRGEVLDTDEIDRSYERLKMQLYSGNKSSTQGHFSTHEQQPSEQNFAKKLGDQRTDARRSALNSIGGSQNQQMHSREISVQHIGVNRGAQISTLAQPSPEGKSQPVTRDPSDAYFRNKDQDPQQSYQNVERVNTEDSASASMGLDLQRPIDPHIIASSAHKNVSGGKSHMSSSRSKSLDLNLTRQRMYHDNHQSHSLQKHMYAEEGKGRHDYILRFNDNSGNDEKEGEAWSSPKQHSTRGPSNGSWPRVRSSSPRHKFRQTQQFPNGLVKAAISEKMVASPRFSQNAGDGSQGNHLDKDHCHQRSRNEFQAMNEMIHQNNPAGNVCRTSDGRTTHDAKNTGRRVHAHIKIDGRDQYINHQQLNSPNNLMSEPRMLLHQSDLNTGGPASSNQYVESSRWNNQTNRLSNMHFNTNDFMQMTYGDSIGTAQGLVNQNEGPRRNGWGLRHWNQGHHSATGTGTLPAPANGGWGSEFQTDSLMTATQEARVRQEASKVNHEALTSDQNRRTTSNYDDTFRGENFIQQSNMDGGPASLGTLGSVGSQTQDLQNLIPQSNVPQPELQNQFSANFGPDHIFQTQGLGNFTLNDLNNTHGGMTQAYATGDISNLNCIHSYNRTIDSSINAVTTSGRNDDNTTLAATGPQQLPKQIHQNNHLKLQLQQSQERLFTSQNKNLQHRLDNMVEKIWLKQNLSQIHQNLSQTQLQIQYLNLQGANRQKFDQHISNLKFNIDYKKLNQVQIVSQIDHLTKKILNDLSHYTNQQSQHHVSRGLSKLSDIDSTFQISKISARGQSTHQQHQNQATNQYINVNDNNSVSASSNTGGYTQYGPHTANKSQPFKALNACPSNQSFATQFDQESQEKLIAELNDMRKNVQESETVIANLRKTIKDMAKQMKKYEHEKQADQNQVSLNDCYNTPSLSKISPAKCKSELNKETKGKEQMQAHRENVEYLKSQIQIKDKSGQGLRMEIDQKINEIDGLKSEHEAYKRSMKDKFKIKFDEQNALIDELKTELGSAVTKNQDYHDKMLLASGEAKGLREDGQLQAAACDRAESQVQSLNRQLQMFRNQQMCDQKALETDKIRLQSTKEQEKHWRIGYEQIFQKYQNLKQQVGERDGQLVKLQRENDIQIKRLTMSAQEAIRHFKDIALSRVGSENVPPINTNFLRTHTSRPVDAKPYLEQPDVSRFDRFAPRDMDIQVSGHPTQISSYPGRSRSLNNQLVQNSDTPTRHRLATPVRMLNNHVSLGGTISAHAETVDSRHARSRLPCAKSLSPSVNSQHTRQFGSRQPIEITLRRSNIMSERKQAAPREFSPTNQKHLSYIEKIQQEMNKSGGKTDNLENDPKLIFAIEALERAFSEIAQFKSESYDLASRFFQKHCSHLEDLQVLSYDYLKQIQHHLDREAQLNEKLEERAKQVNELREIINNSQRMIKKLFEQIQDQKTLKELQWKNIITYDSIKDSEKRKIKECIKKESAQTKQIVSNLHQEIKCRDQIIEEKDIQINLIEQDKQAIINNYKQTQSNLIETKNVLEDKAKQLMQLDTRNKQIEIQIKDLITKTCQLKVDSKKGPTGGRINSPSRSRSATPTRRGASGSAGSSFNCSVHNILPSNQFVSAKELNVDSGLETGVGVASPPLVTGGWGRGQADSGFSQPPTPHLNYNAAANIQSHEIVLQNQSNSSMYTNTVASSQESLHQPPAVVTHNTLPDSLQSEKSPMMPFEWLDQIKDYISVLQGKVQEDKSYYDTLGKILSNAAQANMKLDNQMDPTSTDQMQILEVNSFSALSGDEVMSLQNAQESFYQNNQRNQRAYTTPMNDLSKAEDTLSGIIDQNDAHAKYVSPGHQSMSQTPESHARPVSPHDQARLNDQRFFQTLKNNDTLSQSLESFVNQSRMYRAQPPPMDNSQSQSYDLNQFQRSKFQNHFVTFNEGYVDNQKPMNVDHLKGSLPSKLKQLITQNQIKSTTILNMKREIERLNNVIQETQTETEDQISDLQTQLTAIQSQKEQLQQIYGQENSMRQDLELQIEETDAKMGEANQEIQRFENQLEQVQDEMNNLMSEKQKIEQSSEYWQGSFKLIERQFFEEKDRSDAQIENLTNQVHLQEDEIREKDKDIDDMSFQIRNLESELQEVLDLWEPMKKARDQAKDSCCQTAETSDGIQGYIEQLELLESENKQIKRDIEVLIDSYDNFKSESEKIQGTQRNEMKNIELKFRQEKEEQEEEHRLVVQRLNQEIQEGIKERQNLEGILQEKAQEIDRQRNSIKEAERDREDAEVQLIQDRHLQEQLKDFNQILQNFNGQLQSQVKHLQLQDASKKSSQSTFDQKNSYIQSKIQLMNKQIQQNCSSQKLLLHQHTLNSQVSPKYLVGLGGSVESSGRWAKPASEKSNNLAKSYSISQFADNPDQSNTLVKSASLSQFAQNLNAEINNLFSEGCGTNLHSCGQLNHNEEIPGAGDENGDAVNERQTQFTFLSDRYDHTQLVPRAPQQQPDQRSFNTQDYFTHIRSPPECIHAASPGHELGSPPNQQNLMFQSHSNAQHRLMDHAGDTLGLNSGVASCGGYATQGLNLNSQSQETDCLMSQKNQLNSFSGSYNTLVMPLQNPQTNACGTFPSPQLNSAGQHLANMRIEEHGQRYQQNFDEGQGYQQTMGGYTDQNNNQMMPGYNLPLQTLNADVERANNTSLGLDICQKCIEHEAQAKNQKDIIKKLVQSGLSQARKLVNLCMEGSVILRLISKPGASGEQVQVRGVEVDRLDKLKSARRHLSQGHRASGATNAKSSITSQVTSQLASHEQMNSQVSETHLISEEETFLQSENQARTSVIRQAQKYLEKDIEKFLVGSNGAKRQERLFKYANEMIEIANQIVQNSCEITIAHLQQRQHQGIPAQLAKCESLKIQDYQSREDGQDLSSLRRTGRNKVNTADKGCQATVATKPLQKLNPRTDSSMTSMTSNLLNVHNSILESIDELGQALDNKICVFVKLMLSLESAQQNNKQDESLSKVLQSFSGAISKVIHELTEDTKALCDIKNRLLEAQELQATEDIDMENANLHRAGESRSMNYSRLSKGRQTIQSGQDMPLAVRKSGQEAKRGQANNQSFNGTVPRYEQTILNFINDDGGTTSESQCPKSEPMLSRKPQSNSSKARHQNNARAAGGLGREDREVLRQVLEGDNTQNSTSFNQQASQLHNDQQYYQTGPGDYGQSHQTVSNFMQNAQQTTIGQSISNKYYTTTMSRQQNDLGAIPHGTLVSLGGNGGQCEMASMESNFNEHQLNGTGDFNSNAHRRHASSTDENANHQNRVINVDSQPSLSMQDDETAEEGALLNESKNMNAQIEVRKDKQQRSDEDYGHALYPLHHNQQEKQVTNMNETHAVESLINDITHLFRSKNDTILSKKSHKSRSHVSSSQNKYHKSRNRTKKTAGQEVSLEHKDSLSPRSYLNQRNSHQCSRLTYSNEDGTQRSQTTYRPSQLGQSSQEGHTTRSNNSRLCPGPAPQVSVALAPSAQFSQVLGSPSDQAALHQRLPPGKHWITSQQHQTPSHSPNALSFKPAATKNQPKTTTQTYRPDNANGDRLRSLDKKLKQNKDILKIIADQQVYLHTLSSQKSTRQEPPSEGEHGLRSSSRSPVRCKGGAASSSPYSRINSNDGASRLSRRDGISAQQPDPTKYKQQSSSLDNKPQQAKLKKDYYKPYIREVKSKMPHRLQPNHHNSINYDDKRSQLKTIEPAEDSQLDQRLHANHSRLSGEDQRSSHLRGYHGYHVSMRDPSIGAQAQQLNAELLNNNTYADHLNERHEVKGPHRDSIELQQIKEETSKRTSKTFVSKRESLSGTQSPTEYYYTNNVNSSQSFYHPHLALHGQASKSSGITTSNERVQQQPQQYPLHQQKMKRGLK